MEEKVRGAALLLAARKKRKLTQSDVAEMVGVHQGAVCSWEIGRRKPELPYALALQEAFSIPASAWVRKPA